MPPGRLSENMKKRVDAKRRAAKAVAKPRLPVGPASFDVEMDAAAQQFLDTDPNLKLLIESLNLSPKQFINQAADLVSKATRKQHLKALAFAYAIWLRASQNQAYGVFIDELRQRRRRYNKGTTDLHLLVEAVVSYGSDSPDERRDKRGLYQRDVAALRYLHHVRIGPDELEDQATKVGEGLDTWARRWPKVGREGAPSVSEGSALEPGIEVVVHTTAPNGSVATQRYAVAYNDDGLILLDRLRGLFGAAGAVSKTP